MHGRANLQATDRRSTHVTTSAHHLLHKLLLDNKNRTIVMHCHTAYYITPDHSGHGQLGSSLQLDSELLAQLSTHKDHHSLGFRNIHLMDHTLYWFTILFMDFYNQYLFWDKYTCITKHVSRTLLVLLVCLLFEVNL